MWVSGRTHSYRLPRQLGQFPGIELTSLRQESVSADPPVQVVLGLAVLCITTCQQPAMFGMVKNDARLTLDNQTERGRMWRFMR